MRDDNIFGTRIFYGGGFPVVVVSELPRNLHCNYSIVKLLRKMERILLIILELISSDYTVANAQPLNGLIALMALFN